MSAESRSLIYRQDGLWSSYRPGTTRAHKDRRKGRSVNRMVLGIERRQAPARSLPDLSRQDVSR